MGQGTGAVSSTHSRTILNIKLKPRHNKYDLLLAQTAKLVLFPIEVGLIDGEAVDHRRRLGRVGPEQQEVVCEGQGVRRRQPLVQSPFNVVAQSPRELYPRVGLSADERIEMR